jgi:hypothetical protein
VTLVVIYGAPGVGKLTTARSMAALTGFKILHNHLTFDLVKAIFDFPTPPFARLAEAIRLTTLEAAANERLPGLIFTFAYASPVDDPFVQRMVEVVERHAGELSFVRLVCDTAAHEQRVLAEDRQQFGKITTVASLREALTRWNFGATVPFRDSLAIDSSALGADAVARRIAQHFTLPIR